MITEISTTSSVAVADVSSDVASGITSDVPSDLVSSPESDVELEQPTVPRDRQIAKNDLVKIERMLMIQKRSQDRVR